MTSFNMSQELLWKRLRCLQRILFLELWRWCFFGSGLAPVWYLSSLLVHGALIFLEAKLFTVHQALYFAVAMKVCAHDTQPILLKDTERSMLVHRGARPG